MRAGRRIPGWAAGLLAHLARDRPAVVTREDLIAYLTEADGARDAEQTTRELQRLGWLAPVHLHGVWAFLPPGEDEIIDPYIDLRGWMARGPDAVFALAGEAAAWHLGYLDRAFDGPVAVWIPTDRRLPHGLRSHLSVIKLGWRADDASRLAPATALLHRRRLDLTRWAGGLPSFGPEALLVQLAARPASFRAWADLVTHLDQMATDCDLERLAGLLSGQSSSAWQRAAYVLHCGNRHAGAVEILARRPPGRMPKVQFGDGQLSLWVSEFRMADRLITPLRGAADQG